MGASSSIANSRAESASTYVYNYRHTSRASTERDQPSRRLTSAIIEEEEETPAAAAAADHVPLTESQERNVLSTLSNLETHLNITFNHNAILNKAKTVRLGPQEELLTAGGPPQGLFVVQEGVLQVLSRSGGVVLAHLLKGDLCGELSVLLSQTCSATIRSESKYVPGI